MGDELRREGVRAPIATPCVNICRIDRTERFCTGCFRTLAEIGAWAGLSPAGREAVMAELPARRQRYHMLGSHITTSGT